MRESNPAYLDDLDWLVEQRDKGAFISEAAYRRKVLGERAKDMIFVDDMAVTLEISAAQYFPWLKVIAQRAIEQRGIDARPFYPRA